MAAASFVDSTPRARPGAGPGASVDTENPSEVVAHRLLQLLIAARLGVAVGAPPAELCGVSEPPTLHVVVGDLEDALGPQGREREVLALAPAALGARNAVGVGDRPVGPGAPR